MSSLAMVVYHHLLTFDAEYKHFWANRKFGFGWTLFLVNRYLPLATSLSEALWWPVSHNHTGFRNSVSCVVLFTSQYTFEYLQYAMWGAISSLRVHALTHSWPLVLFVLLLALVAPITTAVQLTYTRRAIDPMTAGCFLDSSRLPFKLYKICTSARSRSRKWRPALTRFPLSVLILSYATYVLSEIIVVGVTFRATRHSKDLAGALWRGRMSLSDVMFRDGLIYFVAIALLNAAPFIVKFTQIAEPGSKPSGLVNALLNFISPFTSILLTQFYFDLQETAGADVSLSGYADGTDTFELQYMSTRTTGDLQFAVLDEFDVSGTSNRPASTTTISSRAS
ncbi:uncharacterized protein TRAVEDRAFT_24427 [Trametes versicolor FP-101664 SS1]|uniref:uncharacterized protein n=1 Tax=Trametes versicolor (strain FP-101664) TaxID=717944 RepID=UPI0004624790|nr:uncharacterized protein TRAVEDRAFT_24427 [Trametes versicolor FP-101664 SS1]EIW53116.1 hypothetical protein TRAVEDRAFT_24427 [Trametes versicolor FP-101664 SS1]